MAVNDEIYKNLEVYGGSTINERVYNYLGSLGYTGTISDRLTKYQFEDKKGWQALIARYAGSGGTPDHITLVAGETSTGSGYISEALANQLGVPEMATGSISTQPIPGLEVEAILFEDFGSFTQLSIYFLGDVRSSLVDIRTWVGGVELAGSPDSVTYQSQQNITNASYNNPNMAPWVVGGEYSIAIAITLDLWTPAALFAQGQQGAWYEPKPEHLYQDAAGTVPVTADGDPVGLMLDRSRGLVLGPEFVTGDDATLDSSLGGWYASSADDSLTWDSGQARLEVLQNFVGYAELNVPDISPSTWYIYEVDVDASNSGRIDYFQTGVYQNISSNYSAGQSRVRLIFKTAATATPGSQRIRVFINGAAGETVTFDNISVREIPGAHARQATSAARPIHSSSAPLQVYDNVDDAMDVTLPAITAATVAIATPTGADIQYPVDLSSGSYTITESHSGIIIREGELTAAEQQQVTDYLNAQAGV